MIIRNLLDLNPLQIRLAQTRFDRIATYRMPRVFAKFADKSCACAGDYKRRTLSKSKADLAIKCSFIAGRHHFVGVLNIAAANEPSELIFGYSIAPQLSNRHGEIPRIATGVGGVAAGLQKPTDCSLSGARKTSVECRNTGMPVSYFVRKLFLKHPAALPTAQTGANIL